MSRRAAAFAAALILVILFSCVLYWHGLFLTDKKTYPDATPLSDISSIRFEIADTPQKQIQGLSRRADVPSGYGMLFVFPSDDAYGFWMKDMLVPIDIIWLSDTGKIVGIEDSVSPSTYPSVFYPPEPVRYVLEMRAGEARARGWTIGSSAGIPLQD